MIEILTRRRVIVLSSACLQICWLLGIWWTGASTNADKLQVLLVCAMVVCLLAYLVPADRLRSIRRFCLARLPRTGRGDAILLSLVVVTVGTVYSIYQGVETLVAERGVYNASLVVARGGLASFAEQYGKLHWLGIQHPPLIPVLNGWAMRMAGESLLVIRLVSLGFGLGAVLALYGLGRDLYGREVGLAASLFFICFPYFFRLSAAASNDIQVSFFLS